MGAAHRGWGSGDIGKNMALHGRGTWCQHQDSPQGCCRDGVFTSGPMSPFPPWNTHSPSVPAHLLAVLRVSGTAWVLTGSSCIPGREMLSLPFTVCPKVVPWL